ncbi:hypothetical protein Bbelb_026510 [Branchiostoma belcheri]|nr:hypothetical protein Bbelb_026510 [Branchiostoma belcheri]
MAVRTPPTSPGTKVGSRSGEDRHKIGDKVGFESRTSWFRAEDATRYATRPHSIRSERWSKGLNLFHLDGALTALSLRPEIGQSAERAPRSLCKSDESAMSAVTSAMSAEDVRRCSNERRESVVILQ